MLTKTTCYNTWYSSRPFFQGFRTSRLRNKRMETNEKWRRAFIHVDQPFTKKNLEISLEGLSGVSYNVWTNESSTKKQVHTTGWEKERWTLNTTGHLYYPKKPLKQAAYILTNSNWCHLLAKLSSQIIYPSTGIVTRYGTHQHWGVGFNLKQRKPFFI